MSFTGHDINLESFMPIKQGIVRSDAVVLRAIDYGETSRIVTLYTSDYGRMSVLAKGARAGKNRFGSTLDPLSYIQAIVYYKAARDLQTLTDASHIRTFPAIRNSLDRIESGLAAVELTNAVMQEAEANADIFMLLVTVLTHLNESDVRCENLTAFFKLRLATILGYAPSFTKEEVEALGDDGGYLDLESGAIFAMRRGSSGTSVGSKSALRAFSILSRAPLAKVLQMSLTSEISRELDELVSAYLQYHFTTSYPTRSAGVFARMGPR